MFYTVHIDSISVVLRRTSYCTRELVFGPDNVTCTHVHDATRVGYTCNGIGYLIVTVDTGDQAQSIDLIQMYPSRTIENLSLHS